jgi:hypothetical protein
MISAVCYSSTRCADNSCLSIDIDGPPQCHVEKTVPQQPHSQGVEHVAPVQPPVAEQLHVFTPTQAPPFRQGADAHSVAAANRAGRVKDWTGQCFAAAPAVRNSRLLISTKTHPSNLLGSLQGVNAHLGRSMWHRSSRPWLSNCKC